MLPFMNVFYCSEAYQKHVGRIFIFWDSLQQYWNPVYEHRTGIAEVMGSTPVEALIFSGLLVLLSSC